jgi:hypothetical protein
MLPRQTAKLRKKIANFDTEPPFAIVADQGHGQARFTTTESWVIALFVNSHVINQVLLRKNGVINRPAPTAA